MPGAIGTDAIHREGVQSDTTHGDTLPSDALSFEQRFRDARRYLRRRSAIRATAKMLPWLEFLWLAAFVLNYFGWSVVSRPAATVGLMMVLLVGVLWRAWRTPSGRGAALILDRGLGTREVVTAASEAGGSGDHTLVQVAQRRAALALDRAAVVAALPLTGWRGFQPAILGAAAVVLALFLPLPPPVAEAKPAIDPVVEEAAETLARELEPLAAELADVDRPAAEEALERLEQLVDDMREGELGTAEEALVEVSRLEETLRELSEQAAATEPESSSATQVGTREGKGDVDASMASSLAASATDGFDELVQDLGAEPLSADLANAMTAGDREALREALERMGEAMTAPEARGAAMERQKALLEQRLRELAAQLELSGESEAAAAVRELLEALESGDLEKAKELLESEAVAGACQIAGRKAGDGRMQSQVAELLGLARYLLGQAPEALASGGATMGEGQGQGGTSRSQRGRGPHPGSRTTHQQAEGYTTGDPILRDRQTAETADWQVEYESMWQSRFGRGNGQDLRIAGRTGESGEMKSQVGRGLGLRGEGTLPLTPFATPGVGDAERATDLESVPLGYRDLVRRYFDRGTTAGDKTPVNSPGEEP